MEQLSQYTVTRNVTPVDLAVAVGSGEVRVLATPVMIALMEQAASMLAREYLEPGQTTVGVSIDAQHLAPTPEGMQVTATATLTGRQGRTFSFEIVCEDEIEVVGRATHTRAAVELQKFEEKARSKQQAR